MNSHWDGNDASRLTLLPFELRAAIIEEVIVSETPPPKDPSDVSDRSKENLSDITVFYPNHFSHLTSSLSRTCRRIHDEVQALLNKAYPHPKPSCKLDIMATRGGVWPTWVKAPWPSSAAECDLEVDLRVFDQHDSSPLFMANGWIGIISQPLMVILNRLLSYGPQFSCRVPGFEGLNVQTLTMTVHHCVSDCVGPCEPWYWRPSVRKYAFHSLLNFMSELEGQGFLYGKIRQMRLTSEELGEDGTVLVGDRKGNKATITEWKRCGYTWGPDPNAYERNYRGDDDE